MRRSSFLRKAGLPLFVLAAALLLGGLPARAQLSRACTAANTVHAHVVALDQVYFWNRLGAVQPQGMMYALERDVVHVSQNESSCAPDLALAAGQVKLRKGKRPRPLVLRVNQGECLRIHFRNLLISTPPPGAGHFDDEAPYTRAASVHVVGLQYVTSIADAGMKVGKNSGNGGVVAPGGSATYTLYAEKEGTYLLYNGGAMVGGEGLNGSISAGLFGAVNVEPAGSEHYRSQVSRKELDQAAGPVQVDGSGQELHPVINYAATYSTTSSDPEICRRRGIPILRMRQGNEIVHSDLTAIITGPGAGALTNAPASTTLYPERSEPYREFTILFHDEIGATQAFPHFEDEVLSHTLHGVREGFAVNYGAAGAGAEILANRLNVGPMADCVECKYEEFFLTSWAVGDPAMVVDVPANSPCMVSLSDPTAVRPSDQPFETHVDRLRDGNHTACWPTPGRKATKAFFPDDPTNVYHSYLNDHVKFRNLLAGSDDHHIFHLHAHQWLHTPRSNLSSYLDSQAIGQGTGFTYEITFGGSGNLNKTVGDSIFHCHFYPHFAQGMWALWRVHDVFERGTVLDGNGRPALGSRALPDAEILRGTPIPGLVPLPTLPMAPIPGPVSINAANGQVQLPAVVSKNPGFPFFVPGIAGSRPPQPPLDLIDDGGLPRHVVTGGTASFDPNAMRLSMNKVLDTLNVNWLPNAGTPVETVAMNFHATAAGFTTPTPSGAAAGKPFKVNGRAPVRGAPFADPCPTSAPKRTYKGADFQLDVVFNKAGWHFPQQRLIALWEDVWPTILGTRPPEPLFFRARDGECVEYQFTNLVPNVYHLDDFQVETPTDVLGQHIHLVKFDVLASDGAGNGYNYEDGSFSPEEVQERLCAIRRAQPGMCGEPATGHCHFTTASASCPVPEKHPFFGADERDSDCNGVDDFLGAQTTAQRWYVNQLDPASATTGRTIRTVFTHDHFGPSTHQQTGLYAGLVIEPPGSTWYHNETGVALSTGRADGGPTSWQAVIDSGSDKVKTFREFMLEFADFQLAYEPGSPKCPSYGSRVPDWSDPGRAVNPPGRKKADVGQLASKPWIYEDPNQCPLNEDDPDGTLLGASIVSTSPGPQAPCPEAVSADDPGTGVLNYRNEPIPFRIRNPVTNAQATHLGPAGDLAFAYETRTDRADPEFNKLPYAPHLNHPPYPALTGDLHPGDPFTPLLRAYEGDDIHLRVLVGAHEEEHSFTVNGLKWFFEPDDPNSGYRNAQMMGISEWFDMDVPPTPSLLNPGESADTLYKPSASSEFQWNGIWGLLRYYHGARPDLMVLSTNTAGEVSNAIKDTQFRPLDSSFTYTQPTLVGVAPMPTSTSTATPMQPGEEEVSTPERTATRPTVNPEETIVNPTVRRRLPCPSGSTVRILDVTAVAAAEALLNDAAPVHGIIYNARNSSVGSESGPLHDPTGIMFVYTEDLSWVSTDYGPRPRLNQNVRREPLILRANKGECIQVTLRNALPPNYWGNSPDTWNPMALPPTYSDKLGWNAMPNVIDEFNANQVRPSLEVGLHPQLVYYDLRRSDGQNVGRNPSLFGKQTVSPGQLVTYHWYAGNWTVNGSNLTATPVEFGSAGLTSADPIKHTNKGAVGALIVEPTGSTWTLDTNPETFWWPSIEPLRKTRASATVTPSGGAEFREFVQVYHDDVNLRYRDGSPVPSLDINEDAQESGQKGMNYRTDPVWFRTGTPPETDTSTTNTFTQYDQVFLNSWIGGADPETPVWTAQRRKPVRMRVVHPGGHTQAHAWEAQGHIWEELPYTASSTALGSNANSEWVGSRYGVGPGSHFDVLIKNGAGGVFAPVDGHNEGADHMCKDYASWLLYDGLWNLFRVTP